MLRFTLGFVGAWLLAIIIGTFTEEQRQFNAIRAVAPGASPPGFALNSLMWSALAVYAIAIPGACALSAAWLVNRASPRRAFDTRVSGGTRSLVLGGLAGLCAISMTAVLAAVTPVPEWLVLTGTALAFALLGAAMLPRIKGEECLQCGYDLHEKPEARCPECGAVAGWERIV